MPPFHRPIAGKSPTEQSSKKIDLGRLAEEGLSAIRQPDVGGAGTSAHAHGVSAAVQRPGELSSLKLSDEFAGPRRPVLSQRDGAGDPGAVLAERGRGRDVFAAESSWTSGAKHATPVARHVRYDRRRSDAGAGPGGPVVAAHEKQTGDDDREQFRCDESPVFPDACVHGFPPSECQRSSRIELGPHWPGLKKVTVSWLEVAPPVTEITSRLVVRVPVNEPERNSPSSSPPGKSALSVVKFPETRKPSWRIVAVAEAGWRQRSKLRPSPGFRDPRQVP